MSIKPFVEHPNADEHGFTTETIRMGWRVGVGHIPNSVMGYWIEIEGSNGSVFVNMDRVQMKAIYDRIGSVLAGD
jgi:hypothetical protein